MRFGPWAMEPRTTPTSPISVFPAKAGTQIQPERLVGFTWAPAFAGETVFPLLPGETSKS
jgi:hypothetical protein